MNYKERKPRSPRMRKTAGNLTFRKRVCRLCVDKQESVDYKDLKRLERFMTERGKMLSSRISGNCAKHQRMLCVAIKQARFLSFLPYTQG